MRASPPVLSRAPRVLLHFADVVPDQDLKARGGARVGEAETGCGFGYRSAFPKRLRAASNFASASRPEPVASTRLAEGAPGQANSARSTS